MEIPYKYPAGSKEKLSIDAGLEQVGEPYKHKKPESLHPVLLSKTHYVNPGILFEVKIRLYSVHAILHIVFHHCHFKFFYIFFFFPRIN